jgi:GalNAc-alpha-(1->4)-GalNAc-alpha-(1->3)-diNAcBac-PP-undecaprenol alpha-1,4-N-acetyl-D-galactosaminyltransferase
MNKKIVLITGTLGLGGAERVISILANQLNLLGYKVKIIQIYNNRKDYYIDDNIEIVNLTMRKSYIIRNIDMMLKLRREILSTDPLFAISFLSNVNIYMLASLLFVDIPCIVSERSDPNKEPRKKILKFIRKILYKKAFKIVCQTSKSREYFLNNGFENIVVIPNPIEINTNESIADFSSHRLVSIGRLSKEKNHIMLFDAFKVFKKTNPKFCLEIYGEGPQHAFLERYVTENKISDIKFMGFKKDIHNYIKGATGFILTSDFEGMPNALMEALAYGIPSISTNCDIGGPAELIEDNINGYLVDTGDHINLARKMMSLYCDFSLWTKFSSESIMSMKKYNVENITRKWIEILE